MARTEAVVTTSPPRTLRDIRLQKLFLVAVVLKTGLAFLAWALRYPWSLGFWAPLGVMASYVLLGLKRRAHDVSDEKFADSCYYLGFIFTITSIVFALFDLPAIGTHLPDIAVRFGAAMVSTVAGLVVRVYLVSFRPDAADAMEDAEHAVLDAVRKFREGLSLAVDRLQGFEAEVDRAAQQTVERASLQIERLTMDHTNRMASFFDELDRRQQAQAATGVAELKASHERLGASLDAYGQALQAQLATLQDHVDRFAEAMAARLRDTSFPDDYFARHLAGPMNLMRDAARDLATQVLRVSNDVNESDSALADALRRLRARAHALESSPALVDAARQQVDALAALTATLSALEAKLTSSSPSSTPSTPGPTP